MNQTFETIDLAAEARRLMAAFEIEEECGFLDEGEVCIFESVDSGNWPEVNGCRIEVLYFRNRRHFHVARELEFVGEVGLTWENRLVSDRPYVMPEAAAILASAFSKLGLLSPEVEAALKVDITTHQKLEWALEYSERMKAANY